MLTIRPFEMQDYESLASFLTIARPEMPQTADQLHYRDSIRPAHCLHRVWLAMRPDDRVAGVAIATQYADLYDPHLLWVNIFTHPDDLRQGIATALAQAVRSNLLLLPDIQRLQASIREDRVAGIAFAHKHGFTPKARRFEFVLDVRTFDFDRYPVRAHLPQKGVRILSMTDLQTDPDRDRKFYDLYWLLDSAVPMDEPITRLSFEDFRARVINNPSFSRDGTFVAVNDGNEYIGTVALFDQGRDTFDVDITGMRQDYRGQGIATALKVYGIHWAHQQGARYITVANDEGNDAMIRINTNLGFVRQPATLTLQKYLNNAPV